MGTGRSEQHVVAVPLVVHARQASIIDGRLRARGKLRNATLGTLLARVEGMRRDRRWRAARALKDADARSKALSALRYEFGLTSAGAYRVAFDHWQASGWMPTVIDSRVSNAVGRQCWTEVKNWLLGHTQRPGFRPSAEEDVCWGNGNRAGLRLKDARVHWPCQTKRKTLNVELARDWRPGTRKWRCTWRGGGSRAWA